MTVLKALRVYAAFQVQAISFSLLGKLWVNPPEVIVNPCVLRRNKCILPTDFVINLAISPKAKHDICANS
jgi:hypothetical protein